MKKLPIGIQTFSDIRENNYIYIDKTSYLHEMLESGKNYFLSRPRRFGKSLFLTTIEELFKGSKELFKDLYIYDKWDWNKTNPVIKISFGGGDFRSTRTLNDSLEDLICRTSRDFSVDIFSKTLGGKFSDLVTGTFKKTGEKVVVLIDEYDKAIIKNISNPKVLNNVEDVLPDFYDNLKTLDEYIEFIFITGVSKFSGTSLFSGFNSPNDITMDYKYNGICGYTQEDIEKHFKEYVKDTSNTLNYSNDKILNLLKYWYNGYSWDGKTKLYNPYSTLYLFDKKYFGNYWYRTGTPKFLNDRILSKNNINPVLNGAVVDGDFLDASDASSIGEVPLLFQTGYLTIKNMEIREGVPYYNLNVPNQEVKKSLFENLLKSYTNRSLEEIQELKMEVTNDFLDFNGEALKENIRLMLSNIPYEIHVKEAYYHSLFLLWLNSLGFDVQAIITTNVGEIDSVLKIGDHVFVIEIKYSKSEKELQLKKALEEAFMQIYDRKYFEKYVKNNKVKLLAIAFNRKNVCCEFRDL